MAITWNTPTQPVATKSAGGIKWNNPTPPGTTGLQPAQGALGHSQSLMDSIGNFAGGIGKSLGSTLESAGAQNAGPIGADMLAHAPAFAQDIQANKEMLKPQGLAQNIGYGVGEVGQFLAAGGLDLAKGAVGAVKAIPAAFDAFKSGELFSNGLSGAKTAIQEAQAARNTNTAIEAVNPELSKGKLTKATGQVVTGGRELTPPSMFHEQGLTPDQKTINLGTRLKDLNLGDEPKQNLENLRTGLEDTESKLQTKLGDPSVVNLNANKVGLVQNLDSALNEAPTEHRIKDTENMMGHVVDYAKRLVNDSSLNFQGLRDAKTAFYSGAKKEFPSAFTEAGSIDTKSPAGYAIQKVGEMISEHLYKTAPEGSDIQSLIGREADIFRAMENIAPKAAKEIQEAFDAKDAGKWEELKLKYPKTFKYLGLTAAGVAGDITLKRLTGLGI